MGDDSPAPVVPWNRPDVQDALARGDWPTVLRAFLDVGLSQTAIAARTGLSQSRFHGWLMERAGHQVSRQ